MRLRPVAPTRVVGGVTAASTSRISSVRTQSRCRYPTPRAFVRARPAARVGRRRTPRPRSRSGTDPTRVSKSTPGIPVWTFDGATVTRWIASTPTRRRQSRQVSFSTATALAADRSVAHRALVRWRRAAGGKRLCSVPAAARTPGHRGERWRPLRPVSGVCGDPYVIGMLSVVQGRLPGYSIVQYTQNRYTGEPGRYTEHQCANTTRPRPDAGGRSGGGTDGSDVEPGNGPARRGDPAGSGRTVRELRGTRASPRALPPGARRRG